MNSRKFISINGLDRRDFLIQGSGIVSAALLAACDSRGPKSADKLLKYAERKNLVVERKLFRHTSMDVVQAGAHDAGNKLPSYFIAPTVPVWDESARGKWALEVSGLVGNPVRLTLEDLQKLPQVSNRVNHYCVEGWTAVETWTGVPFTELARVVRVDPQAQFVDFQSFDDDYHESWDIESAMHKQTVVAYGLDGKMLEPAHGGPVQLVRLPAGAVATSSVTCRNWRRSGRVLHHIVDPRTGQPADGPWRTVSVAAATCADANAAATAAIVAGTGALDWLAEAGLPAWLVSRDGTVTRAGGWPAGGNEQLTFPPGSRVYGAPPAGSPR
jgi:hypothetical protein